MSKHLRLQKTHKIRLLDQKKFENLKNEENKNIYQHIKSLKLLVEKQNSKLSTSLAVSTNRMLLDLNISHNLIQKVLISLKNYKNLQTVIIIIKQTD